MVYQWKEGARISFPAQIAGRVCAALEEQNALTAQRLVDESRPEDAPLHAAFEWNDTIAAEEWRKHTARHIINSLVIREEAQAPVRAFFNIRAEVLHPAGHIFELCLALHAQRVKRLRDRDQLAGLLVDEHVILCSAIQRGNLRVNVV